VVAKGVNTRHPAIIEEKQKMGSQKHKNEPRLEVLDDVRLLDSRQRRHVVAPNLVTVAPKCRHFVCLCTRGLFWVII
jgi:hypothetical protein